MPQPVHNAIVTPHNDPHLCLKPLKYTPSLKAPKGKYRTSFFTMHGNRVTAGYASIERLEIYGEAEYVVSQSVYRHFAYPILYFAKGIPVPRLRYSLGYAFSCW